MVLESYHAQDTVKEADIDYDTLSTRATIEAEQRMRTADAPLIQPPGVPCS